MLKVITAEQMREVDRLTAERYGVPTLDLMERAAGAVAAAVIDELGGSADGGKVVVICGKGNNGGDGAAAARILSSRGCSVATYLLGRVEDTRGDARVNFERLAAAADGSVLKFEEVAGPPFTRAMQLDGLDVIVDAVFGTGLTRPAGAEYRELFAALRQHRDRGRARIVSADVPSGLDADSATAPPPDGAVEADRTVTFTAPKLANVMYPASRFNGRVDVAYIGSPDELLDEQDSHIFVTEAGDAANWFRQTRFRDSSYKKERGHCLIVAGSADYAGAAALAANSAMRSGVGIVTLAVPDAARELVASRTLPEIIVRGVASESSGAISPAAFAEIKPLVAQADAIAAGCGMTNTPGTAEIVRRILEASRVPVLLDADALNAIAPLTESFASEAVPVVLTPHEGEFRRLLGVSDADLGGGRIDAAREFAMKFGVHLVLKGERTLIADPSGTVAINTTGNSGVGKAGNGDTLAGLIAGFLAQGGRRDLPVGQTLGAAVYAAGVAGDIAERRWGKRVITASDVRQCLAEAFAAIATTAEPVEKNITRLYLPK